MGEALTPMTPADVIHTTLIMASDDMWPDWKRGGQVVCQIPTGQAAEAILSAFQTAGLVVVSADDLRTYLDRGRDLPVEVAALRRLRAALPETGREVDRG